MRTRRAAAWTGTSWRSRRGGEWECLEGATGEGWKRTRLAGRVEIGREAPGRRRVWAGLDERRRQLDKPCGWCVLCNYPLLVCVLLFAAIALGFTQVQFRMHRGFGQTCPSLRADCTPQGGPGAGRDVRRQRRRAGRTQAQGRRRRWRRRCYQEEEMRGCSCCLRRGRGCSPWGQLQLVGMLAGLRAALQWMVGCEVFLLHVPQLSVVWWPAAALAGKSALWPHAAAWTNSADGMRWGASVHGCMYYHLSTSVCSCIGGMGSS